MRKSNKIGISLFVISLIIGLSFSIDIGQYIVKNYEQNQNIPNRSGFWDVWWHVEINDTSDHWQFPNRWDNYKSTYPWVKGSGTIIDPYRIENVTIRSMSIYNSNVYFRIKNCTFYSPSELTSLYFSNVSNGHIINNTFVETISIHDSTDNIIENNFIKYPYPIMWEFAGISISSSSHNMIRNNIIDSTQVGIKTLGVGEFNTIEENTIKNTEYGINLAANNDTISSNTVDTCITYGIYIEGNENEIFDNEIDNSSSTGIYIDGIGNTLHDNTITNCTVYGIEINADDNIIDGNTIENCPWGIGIKYCENSEIINNVIRCDQEGIWLDETPNTTISGNQMTGCGLLPYRFGWSSTSIIDDGTNTVNGRHLYYYENQVGLGPGDFVDAGQIIMRNCNGSFIPNQNVSYATVGILLVDCHNSGISNNKANHNYWAGIQISTCSNLLIIDNEAKHCEKRGMWIHASNSEIEKNDVRYTNNLGIYCEGNFNKIKDNLIINNNGGLLLQLHNNTVSNNTFNYNLDKSIDLRGDNNTIEFNKMNCNQSSFGIQLGSSSDNNIINNNTIINTSSSAIRLDRSRKNTIIKNYIYPSSGICIFISEGNQNTIYSNILIKDFGEYLGFDTGVNNNWDHGNIGNFWSNYGGSDANDDGIGDTPYDITGSAGNQDNFPIWWDPPEFTVNEPTENQIFASNPPYLNVTINGGLSLVKWYSLDNGTTIHFFTSNGLIDQDAWDAVPEGTVAMQIIMSDSRGYKTIVEINIVKQIEQIQESIPSDIIIAIIIGGGSVIGIAIMLVRKKQLITKY